jgi:hypothetical protein
MEEEKKDVSEGKNETTEDMEITQSVGEILNMLDENQPDEMDMTVNVGAVIKEAVQKDESEDMEMTQPLSSIIMEATEEAHVEKGALEEVVEEISVKTPPHVKFQSESTPSIKGTPFGASPALSLVSCNTSIRGTPFSKAGSVKGTPYSHVGSSVKGTPFSKTCSSIKGTPYAETSVKATPESSLKAFTPSAEDNTYENDDYYDDEDAPKSPSVKSNLSMLVEDDAEELLETIQYTPQPVRKLSYEGNSAIEEKLPSPSTPNFEGFEAIADTKMDLLDDDDTKSCTFQNPFTPRKSFFADSPFKPLEFRKSLPFNVDKANMDVDALIHETQNEITVLEKQEVMPEEESIEIIESKESGLSVFLKKHDIQFMTNLPSKGRRETMIFPENRKLSHTDQVNVFCCDVPELEVYEFGCQELKEYIETGNNTLSVLEETFERKPPHICEMEDASLFLKLANIHSRCVAKEQWYSWREKLLIPIQTVMAEHYEHLIRVISLGKFEIRITIICVK